MAQSKTNRIESPTGRLLSVREERVFKYMREHGSISPQEAEKYLHNHRLSGTIHRLRKKGYDIETLRIDTTNAYGEPCWYGRYIFAK